MKKPRQRRAHKQAVEELSSIVVEEPEDFLKRCGPVLAESLKSVGRSNFDKRDYARGEREYVLVSALQSRGLAREYYPVVPLANTLRFSFWIAVAFRFSPYLSQYRLIHVSLIIFEGIAADANKKPLVRAEWDASSGQTDHAQPHWHVYPTTTGPEGSFEARLEGGRKFVPGQEDDPSSELMSGWEGTGFHYAMAAHWDLIKGSHRNSLTEDGLLRWLPSCISYTKNQLMYLDPAK
ncbi:MAG: hypothetical protein ACJ76Y_29055 [Thermoanaerobaculia bacterium]